MHTPPQSEKRKKKKRKNHRAIEMRINGPLVDRLFSPDDEIMPVDPAAGSLEQEAIKSSSCGSWELLRLPVVAAINSVGGSLLRRRNVNSDL